MRHQRHSCLSGVTRKLMLFCFLLFSGFSTLASHFMYGNITWNRVVTTPVTNTVSFTVTQAFHVSEFIAQQGRMPVFGDLYNEQQTLTTGGTPASIPITIVVSYVDPVDSYFLGSMLVPAVLYPANATTATVSYFRNSGRLHGLENNDDKEFKVSTTVTFNENANSPVVSPTPNTPANVPVIVDMPSNQTTATFQLPASDPGGSIVDYDLTPNGQFGFQTVQPGGLSVSNSGVLTFNTVGKEPGELYNTNVTVIDNLGGSMQIDFIIRIVNPTNNCGLTVTGTVNHPDCYGGNDGSINLSVSNTSGVTYKWYKNNSTTPFAYTQDVNCLTAGTYKVVVKKNGCMTTKTFVLNNPPKINITAQLTHPKCWNSCDGKIDITVTGGTPPYCYSWSTGSNAQDLYNKDEGCYTVTVTDLKGCTECKTFCLNAPPKPTATITPSWIYAPGTGSCSPYTVYKGYSHTPLTLTVTPSGGVGPYTYQWSPSSSAATPNAASTVVNPSQTTLYDVTVTDANGCATSGTSYASILNYLTGGFIVKVKDVRCGTNNDKVEVCQETRCSSNCSNNYHNHHNSGCNNYCSNSNHNCNNSNCSNSNHYHGNNTVCVTPAQAAILISQGNCLGDCYSGWWSWWTRQAQNPEANKEVNNFITVYPNPAHGTVQLALKSTGGAYRSYKLIDMSGRIVAEKTFGLEIVEGVETVDINSLAPGIYIMHVENEKGTSQARFMVQ